jgi:hypothetical protein
MIPEKPGGELPPEETARLAGDREMLDFLHDVISAVRFQDYIGTIAADVFQKVRLLAVLDLWFSYEDQEKANRTNLRVTEIDTVRGFNAYAAIRLNLEEVADHLRRPQRLETIVNDPTVQDRVARQTVRLATACDDPKVQERALAQLNDRMMPPPRREAEGGRVIVMGEDVMRKLLETARLEGDQKLLDGGFVEVDGTAS